MINFNLLLLAALLLLSSCFTHHGAPEFLAAGTCDETLFSASKIKDQNINALDKRSGRNPLHLASEAGCFGIVKQLLERGANPNLPTSGGQTPLQLSVGTHPDYANVADLLLSHGAELNPRLGRSVPMLLEAACGTSVEYMQVLQKHGANLVVKDEGNTTLMYATYCNNTPMVQYLLSQGMDLEAQNDLGRTAFHSAVERNSLNAAKLLVQAQASVEARDLEGLSAIYMLWDENLDGNEFTPKRLEMAEFLLENNSPVFDSIVADTLIDAHAHYQVAKWYEGKENMPQARKHYQLAERYYLYTHGSLEKLIQDIDRYIVTHYGFFQNLGGPPLPASFQLRFDKYNNFHLIKRNGNLTGYNSETLFKRVQYLAKRIQRDIEQRYLECGRKASTLKDSTAGEG